MPWHPRAKLYDSSPVSVAPTGAVVQDVRVVAGVLGSSWCLSARMYDLLPVSGASTGAPALKCTICYRCLGRQVVPHT